MLDLFASGIAGAWDFKTKTIPNEITVPIILYGLLTGFSFTVLGLTISMCILMDYLKIWNMGDIKLIVGLSLLIPERFFFMLIGIWVSTLPKTLYTIYKGDLKHRYAYAPYIFVGVMFSYAFQEFIA